MNDSDQVIVLFGGTSDLARKKLLPALRRLHEKGIENPVVAVGRQDYDIHGYIRDMGIESYEESFLEDIYYRNIDLEAEDKSEDFQNLVESLEIQNNSSGRIFYLALPYYIFRDASSFIHKSGLNGNNTKIAFEKPFGDDLESARSLQEDLSNYFSEEQIYRVDHYLGKEMVENIVGFRLSNTIFRESWNSNFVDNVQITMSESFGVEERARFYDSAGAIRDTVQNHLLQMLSLVAMDEPDSIKPSDLEEKKTEALRNLKPVKQEDLVVGQHGSGELNGEMRKSFRDIEGVDGSSNTETFTAFKAELEMERWQDVPFYVRTGKLLDETFAEVLLEFKDTASEFFDHEGNHDALSFQIKPESGIALKLHSKKTGSSDELETLVLKSSEESPFRPNTPKAYENVFKSIINEDKTVFVSWNWLEESWNFTDDLVRKKEEKGYSFPNYKPGSRGPEKAMELSERDGNSWKRIQTDIY